MAYRSRLGIWRFAGAWRDNSIDSPSSSSPQALEQRRREFVKYSKRFSNTLKEYFKEGQVEPVYVSGLYLVYQTNHILVTTKRDFERPVNGSAGPSLRS